MTKKDKHIHILGIGGTFMGNLSLLAKERGYHVTGSDGPLYPPMSDVLHNANIAVSQGYGLEALALNPDYFVIGNALTRGMPIVEALLNQRKPLISGPQWLSDHILAHKTRVIGVAGTHGKTTTSSLLAWILSESGYQPGFLIGGVSPQLGASARFGGTAPDGETYFVLECDEYDSAFFDKRSKFVHYRPHITVLNNLEFDHADIFADLSAIEQQFHHLVRILPNQGLIVAPKKDVALQRVLAKGCWTPVSTVAQQDEQTQANFSDWGYKNMSSDGHTWQVYHKGELWGTVEWGLLGEHNQQNALAAIAVASHIGISPLQGIAALQRFQGVKRRLEVRHSNTNVTVYDDFAHHPTAIKKTLGGLRAKVGNAPIIAIVDIRSNTMKKGTHQGHFNAALQAADAVFFYQDKTTVVWDVNAEFQQLNKPGGVYHNIAELIQATQQMMHSYPETQKHLLVMSNGNLEFLYQNIC
ncbi:MAG: hypothetical protein RLZ35_49 [Pseudomonadota bacterium]